MIPEKAQEILDFWFKETPAEKRFKKDEVFDKTIRDRVKIQLMFLKIIKKENSK